MPIDLQTTNAQAHKDEALQLLNISSPAQPEQRSKPTIKSANIRPTTLI